MTKNEYTEIGKKINEFSKLHSNWDGECGDAPSQTDINLALEFLNLLCSQECVIPTPMISGDGEIGLLWRNENTGLYIDLGFLNGELSYYACSDCTDEKFQDIKTVTREHLNILLREIKEILDASEGEQVNASQSCK